MNSALLVKTPTKTSTCTATKAFRASWAHCLCGGIARAAHGQSRLPTYAHRRPPEYGLAGTFRVLGRFYNRFKFSTKLSEGFHEVSTLSD